METKKTKLGNLLIERGFTQRDFAEMVYLKTGYLIHLQNINSYCTGSKVIKTLRVAQYFADTLECDIHDII